MYSFSVHDKYIYHSRKPKGDVFGWKDNNGYSVFRSSRYLLMISCLENNQTIAFTYETQMPTIAI